MIKNERAPLTEKRRIQIRKQPGPCRLSIAGVVCERIGEPMQLQGQTFDTYQPVDDADGEDSRLFERIRGTGRIIRTR